MNCKDCYFLRSDAGNFVSEAPVVARYGKITRPCNRYPQNILRAPKEPACGEFKPKETKS